MFVSIPPASTVNSLEDLISYVTSNPDEAKQRIKDLKESAVEYQKKVDESGHVLAELNQKQQDLDAKIKDIEVRENKLWVGEQHLDKEKEFLAVQQHTLEADKASHAAKSKEMSDALALAAQRSSEREAAVAAREQAVESLELKHRELFDNAAKMKADLADKLDKLKSIAIA